MKVTVFHNQCLIDVALQHNGNINSILKSCLLNNLSITDDLNANSELNIDTTEVDAQIVNYFKNRDYKPAFVSANGVTEYQNLSGIDYWTIGSDFIVQ